MKKQKIKFFEAVNQGLDVSMKKDSNVCLIGLGVSDPKGIFGTTSGLLKKFGKDRVIDIPIIENAITGIAIGASLNKMRPVLSHQRVEFALLSLEQIINQAAKWFHMSAGKQKIPIVIRLIIGRGWGQGAQHCQSLEALFSHIPGLKVVSPSNPTDAKGLLISAIKDNNPVIFFEHRWLHNTFGFVNNTQSRIQIGKAKKIKTGKHISIITYSYGVLLAIQSSKVLKKIGIDIEIIDLRSLRPLDKNSIIKSVKKTKRALVIDNGWMKYGISSEILSILYENKDIKLKERPIRIGFKDTPIPSSRELAKHCYPYCKDIVKKVLKIFNRNEKINLKSEFSDIPDKSFLGPF